MWRWVDAEALGDGGQVEQRGAAVVVGLGHCDLQGLVVTALGPGSRYFLSQPDADRRSAGRHESSWL